MSKTIRIGVVGAGANTRLHHIPKLQAIDGVEVNVVANRSTESSQRAADDFSIPRIADSWKQVVIDPEIDAVVIGTWPYLHKPVTLAAFDNGKHVLCEARMAMNSLEAREMSQASLEHPDLTAQIVPSPMTLGVDATIKRLIAEGYLGTIVSAELRGNSSDFVDLQRVMHWRENRVFSGNNILGLGIWYEALLRWIGPATRVTAMGRTHVPMRPDSTMGRTSDIPDHIDVVAEMAIGAQAHFQLSSVTGVGGTAEAFLYGTEGTLRFSNGALHGARRGEAELSPIAIPANESASWRVEEEFIGAIRGEEKIELTDFATGVRYMEFTDAVSESIRQGVAIGLPLE